MEFFDRKNELALLRGIRETAKTSARLTVLKGRRRVGKTSLLQQAYGDEDFLYFFVARKTRPTFAAILAPRYLGILV